MPFAAGFPLDSAVSQAKRKKAEDKSEPSKPDGKKEKPKRSLKPLLTELLARFDRLSRPVQRLLRRTGLARVSLRAGGERGGCGGDGSPLWPRECRRLFHGSRLGPYLFPARGTNRNHTWLCRRTGGVLLLGRDTAISLRGAHRGAAARLLDADRADSISRRQGYP